MRRSFAARRPVAVVAALILGSGLSTAACSDDDGDGADITQNIEEGAEDAGNKIEEGAQEAEEGAKDAGGEIKDGAEDAADDVQDGTDGTDGDNPY